MDTPLIEVKNLGSKKSITCIGYSDPNGMNRSWNSESWPNYDTLVRILKQRVGEAVITEDYALAVLRSIQDGARATDIRERIQYLLDALLEVDQPLETTV